VLDVRKCLAKAASYLGSSQIRSNSFLFSGSAHSGFYCKALARYPYGKKRRPPDNSCQNGTADSAHFGTLDVLVLAHTRHSDTLSLRANRLAKALANHYEGTHKMMLLLQRENSADSIIVFQSKHRARCGRFPSVRIRVADHRERAGQRITAAQRSLGYASCASATSGVSLSSAAVQLERRDPSPPANGAFVALEKRKVVLCLLLATVTLAFYNPVAHNGFVFLDDAPYILNNPPVQAGITWGTVKWAFTSFYSANWHPLTWLSHALDCQLFGLNPAGHHYVSLLFHATDAILLFLLLLEATGATWPCLMVAALFALHPENVESVAWAAERKNVLSTFFFLLALWAYGRYVRRAGVRSGAAWNYAAVTLFFALGLMAKPQIVTLPFVLLLWDYWPLRRMFARPGDSPAVVPRSLSYLVLEKLPLLVLAAAASAITVWAQRAGSAVRTLEEYSLSTRLKNAAVSYAEYLAHTFWPVRLAPMYPHPENSLPGWEVGLCAALLLLLTGIVIRWRDRRYLPVGWFWFLGILVPMIGIVQVGQQAMADRYAYIPMIGLFVALVWTISEAAQERKLSPAWLAIPAVIVLGTLGTLTDRQLAFWHDGESLWRYTLKVTKNNYQAHEALAMVLDQQGRPGEAIGEFQAAENLHAYPLGQVLSLGIYEERYGYLEGAAAQYTKVSQGSTDAHLRATALAQMGEIHCRLQNYEQGRLDYEHALELNPDSVSALIGAGLLAQREGNSALAVSLFSQAAKVAPNDAGFLILADALRRAGRPDEAKAAENAAKKISPDLNQARKNVEQTYEVFGVN
jgi:protein O-mannosyl-transferase